MHLITRCAIDNNSNLAVFRNLCSTAHQQYFGAIVIGIDSRSELHSTHYVASIRKNEFYILGS